MKKALICSVAILFCVMQVLAQSSEIQTKGKVCGNPSAPCSNSTWKFESHDLTFKLPRALKWHRNYYSPNFYAIILGSMQAVEDPDGPAGDAECSGYFPESVRIEAQKQFPGNKVFISRFGCDIAGIAYTNVNYDYNILAAYAGETETQAINFLKTVKGKGYPDANVRKMQVVLGYGD
jgi:hypothetical protein